MTTKSQGKNAPNPQPEALDEKITHLTEEVAKKASAYRVPVLVLIIAIVAGFAINTMLTAMQESKEQAWSEDVYVMFSTDKPVSEVRAAAPKLASDLEGAKIEPFFATKYAQWLWEQNEGDDRSRAVQYLEEVKARHEGSPIHTLLVELQHTELKNALEASQGFEMPPIPEPADPTASTGGLPGGAPFITTDTPGVTVTTTPPPTDAGNASDAPVEDGATDGMVDPAPGDGGR